MDGSGGGDDAVQCMSCSSGNECTAVVVSLQHWLLSFKIVTQVGVIFIVSVIVDQFSVVVFVCDAVLCTFF